MQFKSSMQQRIEAFEAAHGGRKSRVRSPNGQMWLFPDGARRDTNSAGILEEPPQLNSIQIKGDKDRHEWEILLRRIEYHQAKLEECRALHKRQYESMAGTDYSEHDWKTLERLRARVDKAQRELTKVVEKHARNPIYQNRQAASQARQETERRVAEKNNKLKELKI